MVDGDDVQAFVRAYSKGATADFLQAKNDEGWGATFTVAPCSPPALERAGRQFTRARAREIRHVRRAVLTFQNGKRTEVAIYTMLPARRQDVFSLSSGTRIVVGRYLTDAALTALEDAFMSHL